MLNYDLIVVGGETAGVCSALQGAKKGLSVLLIEEQSFLGGTQTGGLVSPIMQTLTPGKEFSGNISAEIIDSLEKMGGGKGYWFNPETLKLLLEDMCIKNKILDV